MVGNNFIKNKANMVTRVCIYRETREKNLVGGEASLVVVWGMEPLGERWRAESSQRNTHLRTRVPVVVEGLGYLKAGDMVLVFYIGYGGVFAQTDAWHRSQGHNFCTLQPLL